MFVFKSLFCDHHYILDGNPNEVKYSIDGDFQWYYYTQFVVCAKCSKRKKIQSGGGNFFFGNLLNRGPGSKTQLKVRVLNHLPEEKILSSKKVSL